MSKYKRPFPIKPFREACMAVREAAELYDQLEPERKRLLMTDDYSIMDRQNRLNQIEKEEGENGVMRYHADQDILKAREKEISTAALAIVNKAKAEYLEAVKDMFTVRPDQLTGDNAGELQLIQLGLIDSPDSLRAFMDRNYKNPALMMLAERYAADMASKTAGEDVSADWMNHDSCTETRTNLENFVKFFDDTAIPAANNPRGYAGMMVIRDNMEPETMLHYNLTGEYGEFSGTSYDVATGAFVPVTED